MNAHNKLGFRIQADGWSSRHARCKEVAMAKLSSKQKPTNLEGVTSYLRDVGGQKGVLPLFGAQPPWAPLGPGSQTKLQAHRSITDNAAPWFFNCQWLRIWQWGWIRWKEDSESFLSSTRGPKMKAIWRFCDRLNSTLSQVVELDSRMRRTSSLSLHAPWPSSLSSICSPK